MSEIAVNKAALAEPDAVPRPLAAAGPSAAAPARSRFAKLLCFVQSAWFAYLMILLLQLKVIWGAWGLRDLSPADTSSYYEMAVRWYRYGMVDIVWSPLYQVLYGTLMYVTHDAFAVTTLHRLIIVVLATAGVLAVLRRMLPPAIAWAAAAWWAVLPINFDTLYEVHLFALLPVLAVWLVIAPPPPRSAAGGEWRRGVAMAILVLCTFLVRNELIVAVGCLGIICVFHERRKRRLAYQMTSTPGQSGAGGADHSINSNAAPPRIPTALPNLGVTLLRYAIPTLLALLLVVGAYFRSYVRFGGYVLSGRPQPDLREQAHRKHTLNMAQVYAFGYQQRHREWAKSPWTDCKELSQQTFGRPDPSIIDMLRNNPRATFQHFVWNLGLTPAGLQVLLFNATSFTDSPDYVPVNVDPLWPRVLSLAALAVALIAMVMLTFRWRYWWNYWLRDRAWVWAGMLSVASTALAIIPTQRPRPSYLFSLSVMLMTFMGMCAFIIVHTLSTWIRRRDRPARAPRIMAISMAVMMAALVFHVPSYYVSRAEGNPPQSRPLLGTYLTLLPYRPYIRRKDTVFLKGDYSLEVSYYLGLADPKVLDYSVLDGMRRDESLAAFLDRTHVNLLFLDSVRWSDMESKRPGIVQQLIEHGKEDGWRLVGFEDGSAGPSAEKPSRWLLFRKAAPDGNSGFDPAPSGL